MLAIVALLYGVNLNGFPEYVNDDEGTYYSQAWAVLHEHVMAHYTYWYDHPPLGWMQLAVLMTPIAWLEHSWSVLGVGRTFMGLIAVVSAGLVYALCRKLGAPVAVAVVAPLLWALCPLTVGWGRSIYLDNIDLVWLLAAMVLVTGKPKLQYAVASGLCLGISVLSKETALLGAPAVLYSLWQHSWRKTRLFAIVGWLVSLVIVVSGYFLFAGLKGEIFPGKGHDSLLGGVLWQLADRQSTGFLFDPGSISYGSLMNWFAVDRYLLISGFVAAMIALLIRPLRPIAAVPIVYLLTAMRGGYLPAMYPTTADPFLAVLIVCVVWRGFGMARVLWRGRTPSRVISFGLAVGLSVTVVAVSVGAYPSWSHTAKEALSQNQNIDYEEALAYTDSHVPHSAIVLTDDNAWPDLVAAGWSGKRWYGPLWFYKLDRDPEAHRFLKNGWRNVSYILIPPGFHSLIGSVTLDWNVAPEAVSALENSVLIKQWGSDGPSSVQLRRVVTSGKFGCVKWSCPKAEPLWDTPGIGGSTQAPAQQFASTEPSAVPRLNLKSVPAIQRPWTPAPVRRGAAQSSRPSPAPGLITTKPEPIFPDGRH